MNSLGLAVEAVRFSEEESGNIQNMTAQIHQDELLQISQEWLIAKNGKAGNHVEPGPKGRPNFATLENSLKLAQGRLPSPVFVDHQGHTRLAAGLDHFFRDSESGRHRLLADHG